MSTLLTGLLSFNSCHEAAGNPRADSSGNGNDYAETGLSVARNPGVLGYAARFNNQGGDGWLSRAAVIPAGPCSVSLWFELLDVVGPTYYLWTQDDGAGNVSQYLCFTLHPGGALKTIDFGIGGNVFSADMTGMLLASNWHHVVGTFDGSNATIYLDGVARAGGPATFSSAPGFSGIGADSAGNNELNGKVELVGQWSRALTGAQGILQAASGEIAMLYNGHAGLEYSSF